MKMVILVSFLLFLPVFSSGLVENSHFENAHYEVVTNGGRIDLEMDYAMPHPRRPTPSDQRPPPPPPPKTFEEVATNGERIDLEIDYAMPHPRRPTPSDQRPPPPPPPPRAHHAYGKKN